MQKINLYFHSSLPPNRNDSLSLNEAENFVAKYGIGFIGEFVRETSLESSTVRTSSIQKLQFPRFQNRRKAPIKTITISIICLFFRQFSDEIFSIFNVVLQQ